jgi:hypothetical protein
MPHPAIDRQYGTHAWWCALAPAGSGGHCRGSATLIAERDGRVIGE